MDLFVLSFENCYREQFLENTNTILVLCFLFFSFFFVVVFF